MSEPKPFDPKFTVDVRTKMLSYIEGLEKMQARGFEPEWEDILVALRRQGLGYAVFQIDSKEIGVIYDLSDPNRFARAARVDPILANKTLERLCGNRLIEANPAQQAQAELHLQQTLGRLIKIGDEYMRRVTPISDDPDARIVMLPSRPQRPTASAVPPPARTVDYVHVGGTDVAAVRHIPRETAPEDQRIVMSRGDFDKFRNADVQLALSPESRNAVADNARRARHFDLVARHPECIAQMPVEMRNAVLKDVAEYVDRMPDPESDPRVMKALGVLAVYSQPQVAPAKAAPENTRRLGM